MSILLDQINSSSPVPYQKAVSAMESIVDDINLGKRRSAIWLLEHMPIYTAGTGSDPSELIDKRFPVYKTGRGGKYTYHGPGQRVAYLMVNLRELQPQKPDIKGFVRSLEDSIILAFHKLGVQSFLKDGLIGVWAGDNDRPVKIAAVGIRVRKWVTYHGVAINIRPNLSDFNGIIPCGIKEYGVSSLKELGCNISLELFDKIFIESLCSIFGFKIYGQYEENHIYN